MKLTKPVWIGKDEDSMNQLNTKTSTNRTPKALP